MKKFLLLFMAVASLIACVKGETSNGCPTEVRFTGDIAGINTRVEGANSDVWTQGDHIGIYMIKNTPGELNKDMPGNLIYGNAPYDASASNTTVLFNPVATPLIYPEDDTEVKFIAYYPYSGTKISEDYFFEADLTDQSNQEAIDILFATTSVPYKKSSASVVPLQFKHTLVKLIFKFTYAAGTTPPEDKTMTVSVSGQYPKASLYLNTGNATGFGEETPLTASGTTDRVEMTTVPSTSTAEVVFTFTNAAGDKFSAPAPSLSAGWMKGYRYTYNVVLRDDVASINGTIDPWQDTNNSDSGNDPINAGKVS